MKTLRLLFLFTLFFSNFIVAQKGVPQFEIKISLQRNKVVLQKVSGTNFIDMSISKNEFYLNQNGMIDIDKDQEELTISDFVFSVKKVGKTIYFKSFKGTIWRDMSIVLDDFSYGVINQNGISTKPL